MVITCVMQSSSCELCQNTKAHLKCGHCQNTICKKCALFLDEGSFAFLDKVPVELKHTTYCLTCFQNVVTPAQEAYQSTLEQAKQVNVYFKKQNKETRRIKQNEKPISVTNCADQEELLLRLAFLATQLDCNGLIEVEVSSKKVKLEGSYTNSIWQGTGLPVMIEERPKFNLHYRKRT